MVVLHTDDVAGTENAADVIGTREHAPYLSHAFALRTTLLWQPFGARSSQLKDGVPLVSYHGEVYCAPTCHWYCIFMGEPLSAKSGSIVVTWQFDRQVTVGDCVVITLPPVPVVVVVMPSTGAGCEVGMIGALLNEQTPSLQIRLDMQSLFEVQVLPPSGRRLTQVYAYDVPWARLHNPGLVKPLTNLEQHSELAEHWVV